MKQIIEYFKKLFDKKAEKTIYPLLHDNAKGMSVFKLRLFLSKASQNLRLSLFAYICLYKQIVLHINHKNWGGRKAAPFFQTFSNP